MIDYEEDWLILLLFKLRGSVGLRSSFYALPASLLATMLVQVDRWYPKFRYELGLEGLEKSQLWSASILCLSILISFRTSRAMARFWEGTGLLHQMRGEWFDAVSCLVSFTGPAKLRMPEEVSEFRHTLVRLMSVCHGSALGEIANASSDQVETIDTFGLSNATLLQLKRCKELKFNRVEVLLHMLQTLTTNGFCEGVLPVPPPILSRVYQTLSRGFVNLLNAKKIADTRFPFPYVQLIAWLLLLNWGLIPVMMSSLLDNRFLAFVFTFIPVFGLFSLNYIGIELENPFGDDENDLPLGHFQKEMNRCLLMLLEDHADHYPHLSKSRAKKCFDILHYEMETEPTIASSKGRRISAFAGSLTSTSNLESAMRLAGVCWDTLEHQESMLQLCEERNSPAEPQEGSSSFDRASTLCASHIEVPAKEEGHGGQSEHPPTEANFRAGSKAVSAKNDSEIGNPNWGAEIPRVDPRTRLNDADESSWSLQHSSNVTEEDSLRSNLADQGAFTCNSMMPKISSNLEGGGLPLPSKDNQFEPQQKDRRMVTI